MTQEPINCPLPSRRQWQGRSRSAQSSHTTPHLPVEGSENAAEQAERPTRTRLGVLQRAGLMLGLGALTVAIPLTGMIGPDSSVALPLRTVGTPVGGSTWVTSATGLVEASSLGEEVGAASRARVRTPITVTGCVPSATAADGNRTVTQLEQIYWPLPAGTYDYTSPFGMRIHPVNGGYTSHDGIDLAASLGTPIYAVASGVVVEVTEYSGTGAYPKIRHVDENGEVYYSMYLHQYMNEILVEVGQQVEAGERIGSVGNAGWSTGPHLHLEIHDSSDTPIDPMAWLLDVQAVHLGQEC